MCRGHERFSKSQHAINTGRWQQLFRTMKKIIIVGLLIIVTGKCFSQQDSVTVDKKKTDLLIRELNEKLKSKKYYLKDKDFNVKDISFSYPKKVFKNDRFNIDVKLKGQDIFLFEVDSREYRLTGNNIDLR